MIFINDFIIKMKVMKIKYLMIKLINHIINILL